MHTLKQTAGATALVVVFVMAVGADAATLTTPVAVPFASGPAFPAGRANGNPPDPQYAAAKAIDRDPNTFCCILDDTPGGERAGTIPAGGDAPVTGHMIFDLGRPLVVTGARLTARAGGGSYNPKNCDLFYFADDDPANNPLVDNLEQDPDIMPLLKDHTYPGMAGGSSESVTWDGVVARYIGLRVNSSYESSTGGTHYNFQIGEIAFFTGPKPDDLAPGTRIPPIYVKKETLQATMLATIVGQVGGLRAAVEELSASFPARYPGEEFLRRIEAYEDRLAEKTLTAWDPRDAGSRQLWVDLEALRREALVERNPLLAGGKLLFVKRFTYSPGWYYAEFMRASRFGGNLCVLSVADGTVTELVPELAGGIFDRFDLSFDGRRVVFGYKAAPGKGFRIWEVGVDGRGLRQLTFDPPDEQQRIEKYWHPRYKDSGVYRHHTDDFHPCYLPDGGICFASTRCERGVLCDQGDSLSVNTLYRMDADGGNLQMLSEGALSESTPSVMNDGRILYTRWEYVDKGVIAVQSLWAMHPDGTATHEVYGNQIEFPPVFIHGRAIPGSNHRFVCTATMHHPFAVGPILRLDLSRNVRTHEPIENLTPDTDLSIEGIGGFPRGENYIHRRNGRWVADNVGPLFADPYPLADAGTGAGAGKFFLVACNPDRAWNDPTRYGLYLIDEFGNRVPVYDDPQISCWQPIPLGPTNRPPVIPSVLTPGGTGVSPVHGQDARATVLMTDVYRGLAGVEPGTIRYLRIWEQVPRPWAARRFWPHDETLGQHAVISMYAHIYVRILHGVVPVHEDGSAYFTVPADKNIFFQALDENFMEVQRMRTFVDFQPGESRSCIGCHQQRGLASPPKPALALRYPPAKPGPQPGEVVPRPLYYPTDVQPILDKHCVGCHNAKQSDGDLDLSGELTTYFSRSYENLMRKKLVTYIQEFVGPQPRAQKTNVVPLPPKALGSHASKLIGLVRKGHYDAELSPEELIRLITWADANAPYYGSYFGRRNLIYKDHPDFRPMPTVD